MIHRVDWEDLRTFIEIARCEGISPAARRLGLDHSTVSRRLAKLESSVGHRLLERRQDGPFLTAMGHKVFEHAEAMERQFVKLGAALSGEDGTDATVRLSTYEGISSLYIAFRMSEIKDLLGDISLEIVTALQPVRIERRDADLFLSFYEPSGRGLSATLAGRFKLYLYASPGYLESHGTPRSVEEIRQHRFVTYIEDFLTVDGVRWLEEVVDTPSISFRSTSMITQMNAASSGMGLVLLPAFSVKSRSDLVPVLPDQVSVERPIWLSAHNDMRYTPRVRRVHEVLKRLLATETEAFLTP